MLTIALFLLGKSLIGINIHFSNSFSLIPFTMQFALYTNSMRDNKSKNEQNETTSCFKLTNINKKETKIYYKLPVSRNFFRIT